MIEDVTRSTRKLGLQRETLRPLNAIDPEDLSEAAGGWRTETRPAGSTLGRTSYRC